MPVGHAQDLIDEPRQSREVGRPELGAAVLTVDLLARAAVAERAAVQAEAERLIAFLTPDARTRDLRIVE